LTPYEFLPTPNSIHVRNFLSLRDHSRKKQMLGAFTTQKKTLAPFFSPGWELYRKAPRHDFSLPPHAGTLFYENFDWGISSGAQWRWLARRALEEIFPAQTYAASFDHP